MTKRELKVGTVIPTKVEQRHINDSDPCNKDNCMLQRSFVGQLVSLFGGKIGDYKVKATNHGLIFRLNGREFVCVFDTKTGHRIYNYDKIFKATRSKEKARASVKPFMARLIVEATRKLPVWPAMSEETKKKLRALPKKRKSEIVYAPRKTGSQRELSL